MAAAVSLRQLTARSIDYAGLFPPCSLEMKPALANQAEYARSPEDWMLSTFVLPADRFGEAAGHLSVFDEQHPLTVSALGPRTGSAGEYVTALRKTVEQIRTFSAAHPGVVSVRQLEMALPPNADAGVLTEARAITNGLDLQCFWENSPTAAEETIDLLAENNSTAGAQSFGFKLRTGGVTADAFPSSQQIARALVVATQGQVPIKFTAGLHHPIRQHREEVQTKMHGFVNVLGAGVLTAEHRWNEKQAAEMLECETAQDFAFNDQFFHWREWEIRSERIVAQRRVITSFGSCSFNEPREDLTALGFLQA